MSTATAPARRRRARTPAAPAAEKPDGMLWFTAKDSRHGVICDRIAVHGGTLYVASIVAPAGTVKAVRALLNGGARECSVEPRGLDFADPAGERPKQGQPGRLYRHEARYRTHVHRLGLWDWCHAVFLARDPALVPCVAPTALWAALRRPEFTTPLLPDWMGYVTRELLRSGGLKYLHGQNCRAGLLTATADDLDRIATAGCKDGAFGHSFYGLDVPEQPARESA